MKVKRRVDTVIVEMDIATAEKLLEIIGHVKDETIGARYGSDIDDLSVRLYEDAEVRYPSPLFTVGGNPDRNGRFYIRVVDA